MNLIVSLARSRSSIVMKVLKEMGFAVKYKNFEESVNPDGDYECDESMIGINTYDSNYEYGVTLKLLAPAFLFRSNISPDSKIIILLRNPCGVVESQGKIGMGQPVSEVRRFNYWRLMTQIYNWVVPRLNQVLIIDTDDLMDQPEFWFEKISKFTGIGLERISISSTIIKPEKSTINDDIINDEAEIIYKEMKKLCYENI